MKVSRRDFLKISAGAGAAATFMNKDLLEKAAAIILQNNSKKNIVWLQGQSCTGCSISFLQYTGDATSSYETNAFQVLLNTATDLEFHPTLMPQAGCYYSDDGENYTPFKAYEDWGYGSGGDPEDQTYVDAMEWLKEVIYKEDEVTFVVSEGAIPYERWGDEGELGFCELGMKDLGSGTYKEGHMWNYADIIKTLHGEEGSSEYPDTNVAAFIALGNCGAFGGIPGGNPNPTGAKGLLHFLEDVYGVGWGTSHKPVVNLNGCPAQPEHLVFVYAAILQDISDNGLGNWAANVGDYLDVDPNWYWPRRFSLDGGDTWTDMYRRQVHDYCERLNSFDSGNFAKTWEEAINDPSKCLLRLGCRGVASFNNCSYKGDHTQGAATGGWNSAGVGNWNKDRPNTVVDEVNPGTWCVAQGAPCNGCSTTTYPDNVFGSSFFMECKHSEFLAAGKIPGDASGATPDYEGKGLTCYTCHAVSMPRSNKEWIENDGTVGYGSEYGGSGYGW